MIRLNKEVERLERIQLKIEQRFGEIQSKMDSIEELAGEFDRDLTAREQNKFDKLKEEYDELQEEYDEIQNVIDYLDLYCE